MAAGAAAILLLATGVGIGRRLSLPARDNRPSYLLLLYEGRDFQLDRSNAAEMARYEAEYDGWAERLRAQGMSVQDRALDLTARLLHATPQGGGVQVDSGDAVSAQGVIDGFFIIHATDDAEAVAIARTHPHLGHGGWIALRPIKAGS